MSNDVFRKYTTEETFKRIKEVENIPLFLSKIKEEYQDTIAIVSNNQAITYNMLYQDVVYISSLLKKFKIKPLTNIGILSNNNYSFVRSTLGVMAYSAVACLIPLESNNDEIKKAINKYNLEAIIYEDKLFTKLEGITDILLIDSSKQEELVKPITLDLSLNKNNPACIIYTYGISGKEKGAVLSHQAILKGMINGCYGYQDVFNQKYYSIIPLTHIFGLVRSMLTPLYTGSTIFFSTSLSSMFRELKNIKPNILVLVPALAKLILDIINRFGLKMIGEDVKVIICGGAKISEDIIKSYFDLGINFCNGYGLTEAAGLVSGNPEGLKKISSVGYIYDDQEIKIVNHELLIKGKNLMNGYYQDEEENKLSFVDGYFKTGDLVEIDEDNFLYITGKVKDIIIFSNGENISPRKLEAKFLELNIIKEAKVYEEIFNNEECLVLEVVPNLDNLKEIEDIDNFIRNELNKISNKLSKNERISKIIINNSKE